MTVKELIKNLESKIKKEIISEDSTALLDTYDGEYYEIETVESRNGRTIIVGKPNG